MNSTDYYINIARAVAQKATCLKKHYGAVLVNNSEIIATGFNGVPRHEEHCKVCTKVCNAKDESAYSSCRSVHAEMNCIISASRQEMLGSSLYLAGFDAETNEEVEAIPCDICLRLIKNAGIDYVYNNAGLLYKRNSLGLLEKVR